VLTGGRAGRRRLGESERAALGRLSLREGSPRLARFEDGRRGSSAAAARFDRQEPLRCRHGGRRLARREDARPGRTRRPEDEGRRGVAGLRSRMTTESRDQVEARAWSLARSSPERSSSTTISHLQASQPRQATTRERRPGKWHAQWRAAHAASLHAGDRVTLGQRHRQGMEYAVLDAVLAKRTPTS
jgi:hypothetical protein